MMAKRFIISIIVISMSIYGMAIFMEYKASRFDQECVSMREEFMQFEFNGIVNSKFLDEQNHLIPTIQIGSSHFRLSWKYAELYDSIKVGDSLYKVSGQEVVLSVRETSISSINLKVDCEKYRRPFTWRNTIENLNFFIKEF
jgi:hypothetical protein